MVKTYVPRKTYEVQAVEWQPGMKFPDEGEFHPLIVMKDGRVQLIEGAYTDSPWYCPLTPGCFIVKSQILGYEVYTPEVFHKEFVEPSTDS